MITSSNGSTSLFDYDFVQGMIIALIVAVPGIVAAVMAARAARLGRANAQMLKTNSGSTIGEHVEALRGELEVMAADKTRADAQLAAAALAAVAKLANATEPPPLTEQASVAAEDLIDTANRAAKDLAKGKGKRQ